MTKKLAVIRVRGKIRVAHTIETALQTLKLHKKNHCAVIPDSPGYVGMLMKIKDRVTWGEIDDETLTLLISKRSKAAQKDKATHFTLNSPKKGYGRKGLKTSFQNKGALCYRGDSINDLIKRMV